MCRVRVPNRSEQQFVFTCTNIAALLSCVCQYQACTNFQKILEQPQNCRRQTGDMKQSAKLCTDILRPTKVRVRQEFVKLFINNTQLSIDRN
jgi:TorA maturation chaperone TorD